jgi:hypothetical protein
MVSSQLRRLARSQALVSLDRGEFLAKGAVGLLFAGGVLQIVQQWASVPGDVLWILSAMLAGAYSIIRATLIWVRSGRMPWVFLPFMVLFPYVAFVFAFWLLVDMDVVHGASPQIRISLFLPVLALLGLYLWIKKRAGEDPTPSDASTRSKQQS